MQNFADPVDALMEAEILEIALRCQIRACRSQQCIVVHARYFPWLYEPIQRVSASRCGVMLVPVSLAVFRAGYVYESLLRIWSIHCKQMKHHGGMDLLQVLVSKLLGSLDDEFQI